MLIDSHCHLNMLDLSLHENNMDNVIAAANKLDVHKFICIAVDLTHDVELKQLAERYSSVYISAGLHPSELETEPLDLALLKQQAKHPKVVALGETGLDYHYCQGDLSWQRERFRQHIQLARELKLPLIIHTRAAQEDTIQIMKEEKISDVGFVLHCFTETWEMAKQALDLGGYISFSGIVTFKNATALQDVAKQVPLDRILVETDCPYLTPVPFRGKPNQPAYVRYVAEFIADLRHSTLNETAEHTTRNCLKLFKI